MHITHSFNNVKIKFDLGAKGLYDFSFVLSNARLIVVVISQKNQISTPSVFFFP